MAKTTSERATLTDKQLAELLGLVKGADSVELKATIPDTDQRPTIAALGMDALNAQIRQVFFFDTPDLVLNRAGVVVRARRVQGREGDTVVKLRPVVPDALPADVRRSKGFGVEVDAMPGGYVCSASLKGEASNEAIRKAALGEHSIRKLFAKKQRELFKTHAPEGIELDELAVLGPIFVLKLKFSPGGFERRLVAELWLYPDNTRILELSTKCAPAEAFQAAAETRAFLASRGVDLSGEQQTKTAAALGFYSRELRARDARPGKRTQ
jgi:hypothetical protein